MEDFEADLLPENLPAQISRETPRRRSRPAGMDGVWNTLSLLLLVGIGLAAGFGLIIFQNPYSSLNPFPPDAPLTLAVVPTQTATPTDAAVLPGLWTPTPTFTPTYTPTPTATLTLTPTVTGTPLPPTATLPRSAFNYLLRGLPSYLSGTVMHPDEGCKLWVAGQAYDLKGSPVIGITVEIGGTLNYNNVYLLSLTGTALQYGPGGYEFVLSDKALASNGTAWVQLLNQEMAPLSERVPLTTYDTCDKNLILINFKQVR